MMNTTPSSSSMNFRPPPSGASRKPMSPAGGISYPSPPRTPSSIAGISMSRTPSSTSTATTASMQSQQGFNNSNTINNSSLFVTSTSAPNRLPPKSPASVSGRKLLTVNSTGSSSSNHSQGSGRGRGRRGRSRSKSRSRRSNSQDSTGSSSDTELDLLAKSPSMNVSVDTDSDDLSSGEDFSMLSFDTKSNNTNGTDPTNSPTSVISKGEELLTGLLTGTDRGQQQTRHRRHSHHHVNNSDSLAGGNNDCGSPATPPSVGTKSCLAVPKILQRNRQRVMVADVASVGNASDTLVPAENGRITGRELHETAKALLNDGDYEQALHMFEAILNAQINRFGSEEHSSVGAALHNVGVVRLRMGEHPTAEGVFLRAAAIRKNVLGADHLDLAATLAKLGSSRTALQKFDEGLQDLREALQITRRALGRNHRTVAQILCHIACLYFEAGEMFSAQATFEDALDIYRGIFQIEADRDACMAQMTETLCNIGSIQNKRKNFSGAIQSFREALDLQRGIMGNDHPRVIASLDNLGYSFSKSKAYNQALICYKEMLNAQVSHHGSFTMDCCDTLKKQVLIYGKVKNMDGAIQAVEACLAKAKENEDSLGDPVVLEVEQMLADLKSSKKFKAKNKSKKPPRDRSLDCFDRILFDKRRAEF